MKANFRMDLAKEKLAVKKLITDFPFLKESEDGGKKYDVLWGSDKIELKFESRRLGKNKANRETLNVAIEQYSSIEKGSVGGPWRSVEHGVPNYWSVFLNSNVVLWFDSAELCNFMETQAFTKKAKGCWHQAIPNRGYDTLCWMVPIEHLVGLASTKVMDMTSKGEFIPIDKEKFLNQLK